MRLPAAFWVIAALFACLCAVYNAKTPYRQPGQLRYQRGPDGRPAKVPDVGAPDERQHANYVRRLMDGKGFPVLDPADPDLGENYQGHQPPLYYIVEAGWCKLTGSDPTQAGSGFVARLPNLLVGLVTLWGVFMAVRWGMGDDDVALAATAFAGLMPMSVALHAAVTNDPLLYCLCTWCLAFVAKGFSTGLTRATWVSAGLCAGLAILTKTTGLVLLPVLLAAAYLSYRSPRRGQALGWMWSCLVGLVVALPWLARNKAVYGDYFAVNVFNLAFKNSPQASVFIDGFGPVAYWTQMVLWWTSRSFVGAFGYMDIFIMESGGAEASGTFYAAVFAVLGLVAAGAVLSLVKARKAGRDEVGDGPASDPQAFHMLNALTVLLVTVLFVRFNLQYFQGQARYLYPAMLPLATVFGMGVVYWSGSKAKYGWVAATVFLLALNVLALGAVTEGFALRLTSA
ncbi:MAG: glycosyltransferase family 39 protein [Fimbriimonadaceae bacterium]|nr:glycosyltransferase family 39 protein [Fimbriimonadaceae bacterium]